MPDADAAARESERARLWERGQVPDARVTLRGMTWRSTLPLAAALVLGLGVLLGMRLVARPLAFLVIAIAIAEALSPPVAWLERRIPRGLAIFAVYLVVGAGLGALGWIVLPTMYGQVQELVVRAPELIERVRVIVDRGDQATGGQVAALLAGVPRLLGAFLVALPLRVLAAFVDVVLVAFLSLYWLIGAPALERFALSLFPAHRHAKAERVMQAMGQAMGGYVRGAAINAVVMGALAWAGLSLIGVNYALVLGVLTMLGEPVPIIGPIIVAVPVVLVAFLQSPSLALFALLLYIALQQIEGQLLTPLIMRQQTDVPQTLVIFAVVAGGAIGGLLGVLVSIPLAAALRVFALEVVVPVVRRWTGADANPPLPALDGAATPP
jgi:predicted PurR-regulated permease PerM